MRILPAAASKHTTCMFNALKRSFRQHIRAKMEGGQAAAQKEARNLLQVAIKRDGCALALMRLAMHDSLTFDAATRTGGANASIETSQELAHRGNEGLQAAIDVLEPIKKQVPSLSFAGKTQTTICCHVLRARNLQGMLVDMDQTRRACTNHVQLQLDRPHFESPGVHV